MDSAREIRPNFWFYLSCLRPKYLIPDLEIGSLADLNCNHLQERRIQGVILDVDNTITSYDGTTIDERVREKVDEIKKGFKTCLMSNTDVVRMCQLERYFSIPVIQTRERKPLPQPFEQALAYLETKSKETAIVGDRLLTDIAGAKRMGLYTIKVSPLKMFSEPFVHTLARGLETAVLRFYQE